MSSKAHRPVSTFEAEAYELPELDTEGSAVKPYDDEDDALDEADRLIAEADKEGRLSDDLQDAGRRNARDEEVTGHGNKVEELIARVGHIFLISLLPS